MFEKPAFFYLLFIVPFLTALFIFFIFQYRKSAKKLAGSNVNEVLPYYTEGQKWIATLFYTIGFLLFIIALARPKWGIENINTNLKGRDVLILLDVSYSMAVPDVVPSRLELSKKYINELLESGIQDRIGLMVFSSESELLVPVTYDYSAISFFLESIYPGMIGKGGTDIGNALLNGVKSFDDTDISNKMIILLTDGEDLEGKVKPNEKVLKTAGIKIFTVGIGTKNGEPVPLRNKKGEIESYVKDPNGNHVVSRLDEQLLSELAALTGGSYMRTGGQSGELTHFLKKIKNIDAKEYEKIHFTQKKDQYVIFLGIGLLLFCCGFLLDLGRWMKRGKIFIGHLFTHFIFFVAILFFSPVIVFPQSSSVSSPDQTGDRSKMEEKKQVMRTKNGGYFGNKCFEKGEYQKAVSKYATSVFSFSDDPLAKLYFNLANAFVKTQDLKNASKYYEKALDTANSRELKGKILYNAGILEFKNKQYAKAAGMFKESLKQNDISDDTRYNYTVAKLFAEQKEKQEQDDSQKEDSSDSSQTDQEQKEEEKQQDNMEQLLKALENKEKENSRKNAEAAENKNNQWRGKYW